MSTEAPILTQEKLEFLQLKLTAAVPISRRKDLSESIDSRRGYQLDIESKVGDFAGKVEGFVAAIPEVEARRRIALRNWRVTVARVKRGYRSTVGGVIEGIRREVLAHEDFRPPLIWRPLKCLAIKEPHPEVSQKTRELNDIKDEVVSTKALAQRQTDQLKDAVYPEIDKGYESLQRAENNILAIYRRAALAGNDEGIRIFVQAAPWQAEQLVAMYVREKADDPMILAGYQAFVRFMQDRFKYTASSTEYNMTPEGYREIRDSRVTNCWKAFVGYRKLMELAELGLIPQPAMPEVFDIAGPNIIDFVPVSKKPGITQF